MTRTRKEMILSGLGGKPINDLVSDWTFTIEEVAPYVYKAKEIDTNGQTVLGAGGSADEALNNCLDRVNGKNFIRNLLKEVIRKIKTMLGLEKHNL